MSDLVFKYKKSVRDIYLSNDIGRESPFDPFKDRTVTKFMTKPDTFVSDGMYYAEKKGRRVPCMVNYNHVPHKANVKVEQLSGEGGPSPSSSSSPPRHGAEGDEGLLSRQGYARPDDVKDVSFTRSQRFNNEGPRNHVQLRKYLMEEREEAKRQEDLRKKRGVEEGEGEGGKAPSYTVPDVVRPPDCSHAPTFGTPPPKEEYSLLKGKPKFTQFGFETKKQKNDKSSLSQSPVSLSLSAEPLRTEEDEQARAAAEQSRLLTSAADAQEAWEAKRKEMLAKHGMITGNKKELLRAKALARRAGTAQGIADFSLLSSRVAPATFLPKEKEIHDLLYAPSYTATTRDVKRMADVRLDKYAGRTTRSTVLKDNVDKLLTIENLSKFYKNQVEAERKSVFITPDQQQLLASTGSAVGASGARDRQHSRSVVSSTTAGDTSNNLSAIDISGSIKPFSPVDDYALHPPTPPKGPLTRKFTKTPDLSCYADRCGEPIRSVLGGDTKERERKARIALRKEGLL